jgi:hypothetical protein
MNGSPKREASQSLGIGGVGRELWHVDEAREAVVGPALGVADACGAQLGFRVAGEGLTGIAGGEEAAQELRSRPAPSAVAKPMPVLLPVTTEMVIHVSCSCWPREMEWMPVRM